MLKKPLKKISVLLTATALAAVVAGCTPEQEAALRKFCADNQIADCELFINGASGAGQIGIPRTAAPVKATVVAADAAPADLAAWATEQQGTEQSAYKVLTSGEYTYIGISGGLMPTGGYRIDEPKVEKQGDGWLVTAKVLAPEPGSIVTMALTNPIGYFQVPKLDGKVEVKVLTPEDRKGTVNESVVATILSVADAPADLTSWAAGQQGAEESNYKVTTSGGYTYVAISGGLMPTGGYQIEEPKVEKTETGWVIMARVLPPAPGSIVTMAFSNPVGYFRFPLLEGQIEVKVLKGETAADDSKDDRVSVSAVWAEPGRLEVTGSSTLADLHFEVKGDGNVLAQADASVKDGQFIANLLVEPGESKHLVLEVSNPVDGELLTTVQLRGQSIIADDEVWSDNFRVFRPRLVAPDTVLIEGSVRAFEGVFKVEVWAGEQKVAEKWLKAAAAAPNFGRFSEKVQVEGGVPKGAEVRFILESAKDGSETTELTVPVAE